MILFASQGNRRDMTSVRDTAKRNLVAAAVGEKAATTAPTAPGI